MINIDNIDIAQLFSSSSKEVNAGHLVDRYGNANADIPSDVINPRPNRSIDKLDHLFSRHSHSLSTGTRPILPQTNIFQNECTCITKAIVSSSDINGHALDKEVLVKDFRHLIGNAVCCHASRQSQHEGKRPHGLSTLRYLQDYKSPSVS